MDWFKIVNSVVLRLNEQFEMPIQLGKKGKKGQRCRGVEGNEFGTGRPRTPTSLTELGYHLLPWEP